MAEGTKHDKDKLRWTLLPMRELEEVVRVLNHGADKYGANNWKKVEIDRYMDALMRHMAAYLQGEEVDPDSGLHHMAHVACNALFIMDKDNIIKQNPVLKKDCFDEHHPD